MTSTAELFSPIHLLEKSTPRTIAVTGGRAELGKSCLVVNLGMVLAQMGKKVLLLDADLNHPGLARLLGLESRHTIIDVFAGQISLSDVIVIGPAGLQVVPGSHDSMASDELSQAQKLLFLEELDAAADDFDFILVDAGTGVSDTVLYFNMVAQERLVVADQDPASVIDAYSLIKMLGNRYSQKRFKILFNKINQPEEPQRSFEQLSKVSDRFLPGAVSLDFLGFIPVDEVLPQSVRLQKPAVHINPFSPASLAFVEIARSLVRRKPDLPLDGNLKFFWQNLNSHPADSCSQGDSHVSKLC